MVHWAVRYSQIYYIAAKSHFSSNQRTHRQGKTIQRGGKTRDEKCVTWRERDFMDYLSLHLTRSPTHRDYHTHSYTIPPRIPLIQFINTREAG